jgi:YesN/AraC family two-component response regulator
MLKVLVVDDSLVARKRIIKFLEKSAVSIEIVGQAVDGVDGLQQFKQFQPDLVVTDIEMPNMDGSELVKHIKNISPLVHILVISSIANEQIKQVIQAGENVAYLQKPLKGNLFELLLIKTEQKILNNEE